MTGADKLTLRSSAYRLFKSGHTYGTQLRENGADVYTIQHAMGHADVRITTKLYVHNDIQILRRNMHLDDDDEQDKKRDKCS